MTVNDKERMRSVITKVEEEVKELKRILVTQEAELTSIKKEYTELYGGWCLCRICNQPHEDQEFAENYNNLLVCTTCEERATNSEGDSPHYDYATETGDNPVFVDGEKCWRRYKFGGFITLFDEYDCPDETEFYRKHFGLFL